MLHPMGGKIIMNDEKGMIWKWEIVAYIYALSGNSSGGIEEDDKLVSKSAIQADIPNSSNYKATLRTRDR
jgi:hypothetical protein